MKAVRRALASPRFWVGVALSVGLMAFALRGISRHELAAELSRVNPDWLFPAAALIVVGQIGRGLRWRAMFGNAPRPSAAMAFGILSVGYLVSNVLPLRLGDGVRAWLVETRTEGDGAAALATVMAERVIDLLTILLFLGLWVPDAGTRFLKANTGLGDWFQPAYLQATVLAGALGLYIGLAVLSGAAAPAGQLTARVLARAGLGGRAEHFAQGVSRFLLAFAVLRSPRTAAAVFAWSVTVWWIGAASYWLVARAFDLDIPMSAAVFAMCTAALFAALLPPSPGYVGAFHTAIRESLVFYSGLAAQVAASYALVLHGLTLAVLIVLGVIATAYLGVPDEALQSEAGDYA